MKNILLFIFSCYSSILFAQNINEDSERWQISDKAINITGINQSPVDENELAIVCGKNQPLMIYNLAERTVTKEIDVKNEWLGYNVFYSQKGNYLLLQEKVIETTYKKSKEGDYILVDPKKGEIIQSFKKISDAKITPDEKEIIILDKGTVYFKDIRTGKVLRQFKPEAATNAIAISPDGKDLAIVKNPTKAEAKLLANKNVDKKTIKAAAKYSHLVTVYDANTFELKSLIPAFYENINLLFYTPDGERLLSFNVGATSYINVALAKQDYKPIREGYLSRTSMQPEFSYNSTYKYFGIATVEQSPSLNIYDVESGSMVDFYNTKMRVWKNMKNGVYAGTNTSFIFLPDDKHVLIAYGNSLIKWNFKKEN